MAQYQTTPYHTIPYHTDCMLVPLVVLMWPYHDGTMAQYQTTPYHTIPYHTDCMLVPLVVLVWPYHDGTIPYHTKQDNCRLCACANSGGGRAIPCHVVCLPIEKCMLVHLWCKRQTSQRRHYFNWNTAIRTALVYWLIEVHSVPTYLQDTSKQTKVFVMNWILNHKNTAMLVPWFSQETV